MSGRGFEVETDDTGTRTVRWTVQLPNEVIRMSHQFPDILSHYYLQGAPDEPVLLYRGDFHLPGAASLLTGDISFSWLPNPHIFVSGRGNQTLHERIEAMELEDDEAEGFWQEASVARLAGLMPSGIPPLPIAPAVETAGNYHASTSIGIQEHGDGSALDAIRFMLPNGWHSQAGARAICDPANPPDYWYGRTDASGAGWTLRLDELSVNRSSSSREEFQQRSANVITHIGELRRDDGSEFSTDDAKEAFKAIDIACRLILAHDSGAVLPVGYRKGDVAWVKWAAPRVAPYAKTATWIDDSAVAAQASELMSRLLGLTADPFKLNVLHYATAYLTTSLNSAAEASTSLCVSGLAMLAYLRLVQEVGKFQHKEFKSGGGIDVERQIRELLIDCKVDPTGGTDKLKELERVQQIVKVKQPQRIGDALSACIFLRNRMIHPMRAMPDEYSAFAWGEASELLKHFLLLAILNASDYQGAHRSYIHGQFMAGSSVPVPWAGAYM